MSEYIDDGKIWAYYNVNTTESATTLIDSTTGIGSTMIVDGVSVSRATSYTFDTTGEHLVKFTPTTAYVGRGVFRNIGRLTELYLPSTITRTDGANETTCSIRGCSLLSKIHLSTSFRQIYPCDFSSLSALTEIENIEYVTRLGNYTLQNCPNLKIELNLPNLTTIGDRIGLNSGFTKIVSLGSITSLPGGANTSNAPFLGCSQLTEATIPATLTSISNYSFYNCPKLKRVNYLGETPPTLGTGVFSGTTSLVAICVPSDSVSTYKTTWTSYASKIYPLGDNVPMNIAGLANGRWRRRLMMAICTKSKDYPDPWVDDGKVWAYYNVTTTESATSLLYSTTSISSMEIDGVQQPSVVSSYQFATTGEHLVKYTMSGTDIPTRQYRGRTALVRLYMPDTIQTLSGTNGQQFYDNLSLKLVRLSANLTNVSYQCFTSSYNVVFKDIKLTKLTTLGSNCFRRAKIYKITSLGRIASIPSGYIFDNVTTMTSVTLPKTLGSIGDRTFNASKISKELICEAPTPPRFGANVFTSATVAKLCVPAESVDDYKTIIWTTFVNKTYAIDDGWSLPSEYTSLPYVQTNSQAYIDTGVAGGDENKWVCASFQWGTFVEGGAVYGNYVDDSHKACQLKLETATTLLVGNNTNLGQSADGSAVDTRLCSRTTNASINVNSTATTITADTTLTDNTANIFLGTDGPNHAVKDIGLRINHFSIIDYTTGEYIIRYIPCKRNSDNKAGFYDRVNNVFKPSDTAVDFVAGT